MVDLEVKVDPDSVPGIGDVGTHVKTPKVRESDNVAVAGEADGRGDVVRQLVAVAVLDVIYLSIPYTDNNDCSVCPSHV